MKRSTTTMRGLPTPNVTYERRPGGKTPSWTVFHSFDGNVHTWTQADTQPPGTCSLAVDGEPGVQVGVYDDGRLDGPRCPICGLR